MSKYKIVTIYFCDCTIEYYDLTCFYYDIKNLLFIYKNWIFSESCNELTRTFHLIIEIDTDLLPDFYTQLQNVNKKYSNTSINILEYTRNDIITFDL